jgi:hypothetical protein
MQLQMRALWRTWKQRLLRLPLSRAPVRLPLLAPSENLIQRQRGCNSPEMPDTERVDPLVSRAAGENAAALAMHAASSTWRSIVASDGNASAPDKGVIFLAGGCTLSESTNFAEGPLCEGHGGGLAS